MTYLEKEKQRAELYRKQEVLTWDLKRTLGETRTEPGLPISDIGHIIKKVFKPEEVKSLIKELK